MAHLSSILAKLQCPASRKHRTSTLRTSEPDALLLLLLHSLVPTGGNVLLACVAMACWSVSKYYLLEMGRNCSLSKLLGQGGCSASNLLPV
jgi:hypothetical protein